MDTVEKNVHFGIECQASLKLNQKWKFSATPFLKSPYILFCEWRIIAEKSIFTFTAIAICFPWLNISFIILLSIGVLGCAFKKLYYILKVHNNHVKQLYFSRKWCILWVLSTVIILHLTWIEQTFSLRWTLWWQTLKLTD